MFRTHTCGELRISDVNKQVKLSGWVQRSRKMGGMTFVDLRDRYGITQLVFNEEVDAELCERANMLGREFVIQIVGTVNERFSKNGNIPTGMSWYSKKRGHCIQGVLWRERKIR